MAKQTVTIYKAKSYTKTTKIKAKPKSKGRHKTTDCCVHQYHNK